MSSVFTKASPAATSSICIVDSSDRTEKQQQQLQQCFSASSSSSSPSALSPTLPPTGNPTALSVQQHQYRTYTYYPSLPAAAKYNGPHLSIPPSTQLRSHFFHTAGAGQSPATGLALGSSPPYDSKIPSFSAQYTGQNTTSGGTGSYITSKVATTLLQLQDPVLHPLAAAPTSTYPPPPPPLKFVPGPPLQQLYSGGHEGSPTLDAPSSSASSPTQPTSYQSAAQFMFQTGHFPPSPYHHNPSPCWSHSPWPYLPFHGITGTTAAGGGGGTTGITTSGEGKINSCNICGKTYARLSTLRSHLKSHSGEKPYQCSICQKSFTQAANLTAHLRTHSGEKPFKCPVCHRGFSQSSSVTTHMRTHSGDRPYKCNVCNKGFADSSTLTKHYRTHTGEKPYQCKICEARFSQSGNLNRHMRTHRHHYVNGMEITMRHI